jgi:hypothetical protein
VPVEEANGFTTRTLRFEMWVRGLILPVGRDYVVISLSDTGLLGWAADARDGKQWRVRLDWRERRVGRIDQLAPIF